MIILFNKPYDVLCQFRNNESRRDLSNYIKYNNIYPAGRLDRDSEGLLVLTDNGTAQHLISHPKHKLEKTYWVQVEGIPDKAALEQLKNGVQLKDGLSLPAKAKIIVEPSIWPRIPPIRQRKNIPTTWIELTIKEGKNRQVRRMTAAVGNPTLRLIRYSIGPWSISHLSPGQSRRITHNDCNTLPSNWRTIIETAIASSIVKNHRNTKPKRRQYIKRNQDTS